MKVKCISIEGYMLSPEKVEDGVGLKTAYNEIEVGKIYNVCGIVFYENGLRYLLYDDYDMAYWYPSELFEVIDKNVPKQWYFDFYGNNEEAISAIWGYNELIFSKTHFDGLSDQNSEDIRILLTRKNEMYS